MPEPLTFLNGRWLPFREAGLPLHDAGLVWGATLTDLTRTFAHRPYRLSDHLSRFRASCERAFVALPFTDIELRDAIEALVAHNAALVPSHEELVVVMLATPGPLSIYAGQSTPSDEAVPTVALHTFPLPWSRYRSLFREGARLEPWPGVMPAELIDPRIKHRSRLHWWLAEQRLRTIHPTGRQPLYVAADGTLTETATANFLAVVDGAVVSPPRDRILNGVSWTIVAELCRDLDIAFLERRLTLDDLPRASEAMLCNSVFCLAGVRQVGAVEWPWPGPITSRLWAAWSERVGVSLVESFAVERSAR